MSSKHNISLVPAVILLSSCCPCRQLQTHTADSVRVETHTEIIERIVRDTVTVTLPAERIEVMTPDTVSVLMTSYAESRAELVAGLLHHSLEQRGSFVVPTATTVTDTRRDSIQIVEREVVKTVEVERELTWWQATQIRCFWIEFAIIALYLLWRRLKAKFKPW